MPVGTFPDSSPETEPRRGATTDFSQNIAIEILRVGQVAKLGGLEIRPHGGFDNAAQDSIPPHKSLKRDRYISRRSVRRPLADAARLLISSRAATFKEGLSKRQRGVSDRVG